VAAIDAGHDGVAPAADARVDDGEEYRVRRILGSERGEEMRRRLDAESRRIVQCVDERRARRTRRENCLYLADVEVGRAEVGEENEGPGARQATAFFSLFFSAFFSSPAALASAPGRSMSMTSASGALSPLRKPVLRMRRYPPLRLA